MYEPFGGRSVQVLRACQGRDHARMGIMTHAVRNSARPQTFKNYSHEIFWNCSNDHYLINGSVF